MSVLNSKDFNVFLYHYDRKRGNPSILDTVKGGFVTGEEQPYFDDTARNRIIDSFEHLTYQQRKEICMMNRHKEKRVGCRLVP